MAVPRYAEKFESYDGTISYTWPTRRYQLEIRRPLRSAYSEIIGAHGVYDHLGLSPRVAGKGSAIVRCIVLKDTAAEVDTEMDALLSNIWRGGNGWLYALGADGSRRRIRAAAMEMPPLTVETGMRRHQPVVAAFDIFWPWQGTSLLPASAQQVTNNGQTWVVNNPGNIPAQLLRLRFRSNLPAISVTSLTETEFGTAATAHVVAKPTVATNDCLVFVFANDASATVTLPSGLTQKASTAQNAFRQGVYVRKIDGTEPASWDFVTSVAAEAACQVYRIPAGSWNQNVNDIDVTQIGATSNSPNPPNGSISWNGDTLAIAACSFDSAAAFTSDPANYTNGELTGGSGSGVTVGLRTARRGPFNATAENPAAFALGSSVDNIAATIVVRAAYCTVKVTNTTNGFVFETSRQLSSPDTEVRLRTDTQSPAVQYSSDDGVSYADDSAKYVAPAATQLPFTFELASGNNTLRWDGSGGPNIDLDVLPEFYASYA